MARLAWLTPAEAPASYDCRALLIPTGEEWESIVRGALYNLTLPENFESLGGLTAEQTVAVFEALFDAWLMEDCPMFAGMVIPAACPTSPGPKWLLCDGSEYAATDYPALYAAIGITFGSSGAGLFNVPAMAGRMPLGVGTGGGGLTTRALGDTGGTETHQLTISEMPQHDHINPVAAWKKFTTTGYSSGTNLAAVRNVESTASEILIANGGDGAHNNMPPFLALNWFIYTG